MNRWEFEIHFAKDNKHAMVTIHQVLDGYADVRCSGKEGIAFGEGPSQWLRLRFFELKRRLPDVEIYYHEVEE
mgnify:CR=1 FL=1